ncbi:hypothetical protein [Niabella sp.]|uniref:DUF6979 family protein n=1 Tax=Niabella sp. TaxID=1962976 RepID=UPI00261AC6B7|nr:hypothetical protein [Niabella sp.]
MKKTNPYGVAALCAACRLSNNKSSNPVAAWEEATLQLFGEGAAQKKGCPKAAFLGLCEEGLISGVPRGSYTNSSKNKRYAIRMVSWLKTHPALPVPVDEMWAYATEHSGIRPNGQTSVVVALFINGYLNG